MREANVVEIINLFKIYSFGHTAMSFFSQIMAVSIVLDDGYNHPSCEELTNDCNYFVAIYNFRVLMEVNRQAFFALQVLVCVELLFSLFAEVTNGSAESRPLHKLGNPRTVPAAYASDFSVVMPGQQHPTCIAQPAPLPCPRERINWPAHEQIT
ncbi:hypothetical protein D5086_005967 [Populus alba]|uniref:Uncharacterized protein n=1 Tax=Populus alba TaxID=43335 RepID=A0ACC4CJ21_POPAL